MPLTKYLMLLGAGAGYCVSLAAMGQDTASFGPLFERFNLTLEDGQRTEAVGPLFYSEHAGESNTLALPPLLLSYSWDPSVENKEFDFAYPIVTHDQFGKEYRFQITQLFSFAGGNNQQGNFVRQFTLFPIYFQQRSEDPTNNYTALMPLYGTIRNRLFRDEIHVVLFPLYSRTRKRDIVTYNMPYPVFSLTRGDGLRGWQFWPLVGRSRKEVTYRTNSFNEEEVVPGNASRFVIWPIFMNRYSDLGSDHPGYEENLLPFYSMFRSKMRHSTTYLWPLGVTHTVDKAKQFEEWASPWPFIVFDRGAGKHTDRVFPFYSRSANNALSSIWYAWPIYKYYAIRTPPLLHERTRSLFFFYSDLKETNAETGASMRRVDLWPLFTHHREYDGNERLQILAIIEPVLPNAHKVQRDYSPLYSLWRAEWNPKTQASSQSLLWNLYRHDSSPQTRKTSLLFGLFLYEKGPVGTRCRIFYVNFGGAKPPSPGPAAKSN